MTRCRLLFLACASSLAVLAALASPAAAQTPITPGQTVTGTLEEGDRQMEDGAFYDAYVIRGRPGETVLVRMRSDDFDTYLHWGSERGGEWVEEQENDDAGDGTDSRLVVRLGGDGEYELRAAGFDEDEEGDYELQVTAMGEVRPSRLRVGQTVEGRLDESDYAGEEGFEDHYAIQGSPGSQITVYAESEDFDTYLVFGAWRGGELEVTAEDDDGGQETNSEMLAEFGDDGVHHVVVRSFDGEETGTYTLRVVEGAVSDEWDDNAEGDEDYEDEHDHGEDEDWEDEEAEDEDEDWDPASVEVSTDTVTIIPVFADEPLEDVLGDDDSQDEDGAYYQQFIYQARAGERLAIGVASDELDAYVAIGRGWDDEFRPLAENDLGGSGGDARLEFMVPRDGVYTVHVSASPGETGAFVLTVRSTR
jgi:hypothetical protein